jgi:hypothetical protein
VGVLGDRDLAGGVTTAGRAEAQAAFHNRPPIIAAAVEGRRLVVDFLAAALPDIADEEIGVLLVETETPRIPQAVSPDLLRTAGSGSL